MDTNVIDLADTLPELAKALRIALDRDTEVREEWIDNKLQIIELLVRARRQFRDNERFGDWLKDNDLGEHPGPGRRGINKTERAAALNLGRDLVLARRVLEESNSWSIELIWNANQGSYNDCLSVQNVLNTKSQETASQDNSLVEVSQQIADIQQRLAAPKPDLVKKFGEKVGRVIHNHFDRNTRTTARLCKKLHKGHAPVLAQFLAQTPDLPLPNNSDGRLGLNTLWRDAPKALAEPTYTLGLSESDAVMKVIADWPDKIGPLVAEWRASGERDAARWYARKVPPEAAAPVIGGGSTALSPFAGLLPAATMAQIAANAEAAAMPRPDPSCRASHEGPIRHHGVDIWPVAGAGYSFAEAWCAMMIWHTIDAALKPNQPNPKTRVAGFFKPFVGAMRNLNPAAGEALRAILYAQDLHPERTGPEDNQCPPYDVIQ
jgi:hypothetical protein